MKFEGPGYTKKKRNRVSLMSDSEIISILVGFYFGADKTSKHYYE
ncbi:hypothetical protein [Chryseobacterium kwangjuense]|uniref:Transposase n=1 Tax=Chryseobacterium kwangjuense TaxID=267125 RepID=A0ABW9JY93_9FLAO|nr:hypothetical protein [Chryseobacterium kwangjuense]